MFELTVTRTRGLHHEFESESRRVVKHLPPFPARHTSYGQRVSDNEANGRSKTRRVVYERGGYYTTIDAREVGW